MTNYTQNNHLKYSIADRLYGYREESTDKFTVSVGTIDRDHYQRSNYADELRRTSQLIYDDFGKDFVVFLSGGTDSEIVVRNFVDIGIKPRCIMIRFEDDFNLPDIIEAIAICDELGLPLNFIDFNVKDFFYSGEATALGEQVQCTQLTYLMVYKCILDAGFPAVMGGEVVLTRKVGRGDSYWCYTFRENEDASAMRFSEKFNIPFVNEYFSYTPELLLYYLEDYEIQELVTEKYNYKLSSVSSKNRILRRLYPSIRPKKKTHGFEKLLGFNFEAYKGIAANQIKRLESSMDGISYTDIIRTLKGTHGN